MTNIRPRRGRKTGPRLVFLMVFVLGAGGCVRRDGRNSDCRWPGDTSTHSVSARHLSADAEFAEDVEKILGRRRPWNPPAWE